MSTPTSRNGALAELIAFAREAAPYYQQAYAGLPAQPELAALPVVDPDAYWQAHATDRRNILTQTQQDGIVLNSSGTSGTPKFSYVAAQEWEAAIDLSARSFDAAGLKDGDRVVTLFATGSLYASLLFATDSLKRIQARVVQFPVGYSTVFADAAKVIETFAINVLAGFPTHILRVIDALKPESDGGVCIDHILYAGELFTPDQQQSLFARYPSLQIHSAGYASVEGGPIGYADAGCTASEHRVYDGGTIIEILDEETSDVIEEPGRPGRIVFTCLGRRLMPLIRYPTGDRAQWVEPTGSPDRKFLLLGRAGQTVRVARYNLDLSEVTACLEPLRGRLGIEHLQIVVARQDLLDRLIFRLVGRSSTKTLSEGTVEVLNLFREKRPDIQKAVEAGILHPPQVEWITQDQLITNERSGKMLAVVDRRNA